MTSRYNSLLVFNPEKRCSVDEALQASYLRGVGQPVSLISPPTSPEFAFPFEYQLKQLIAAEITSFRREKFSPSGARSNRSTVDANLGVTKHSAQQPVRAQHAQPVQEAHCQHIDDQYNAGHVCQKKI